MKAEEKLELLSIMAELQKLQSDLKKIEDRVRKLLNGISDYVPPKIPEASPVESPKHSGVQATKDGPVSIHDRLPDVPSPSAAEIRRHTMDYNDPLTGRKSF